MRRKSKSIQSEEYEESDSQKSQYSKKQKAIVKVSKKKRQTEASRKAISGRPQNNEEEKDYILESRTYNDIIYHFARYLIFFKLIQNGQEINNDINVGIKYQRLAAEAYQIMSRENFPKYNEKPKKLHYVLHPNSVHYYFQEKLDQTVNNKSTNHKEQGDTIQYTSDELLTLMITHFQKRRILSKRTQAYLHKYWEDIYYLVNNPEQRQENVQIVNGPPQSDEQFQQISEIYEQEIQHEIDRLKQKEQVAISSNSKSTKKQEKLSQIEQMKKQLEQDQSIAAYQIACYLHACQMKFGFKLIF